MFYVGEGIVGVKIGSVSLESSMYQEPLKHAFLLTTPLPLGINSKNYQKYKSIFIYKDVYHRTIFDEKHANVQQQKNS